MSDLVRLRMIRAMICIQIIVQRSVYSFFAIVWFISVMFRSGYFVGGMWGAGVLCCSGTLSNAVK